MKIVYLIHSLHLPAGMERVLTLKANSLCRDFGHDIHIVTAKMGSRKPFYELDPGVHHADIGCSDNYGALSTGYAKGVEEYLMRERPDITVAVSERDAFFLPSIKDGSAKMAELHFSHEKYFSKYGDRPLGGPYAAFRTRRLERIYSRMDAVVVLTKRDLEAWSRCKGNFRQIYNPLTFRTPSLADTSAKRALAFGRLAPQKNFLDLVLAWRGVAASHPDYRLEIFGDGDQREQLEKVISREGLSGKVILRGSTRDVMGEMLKGGFLVMSSLYEGFPMVLLEAAECGLPMVSYDCPNGPGEIISDGVNGFLVKTGDWQGLSGAISRMIESPSKPAFGQASKQKASQFGMGEIMRQWNDLFEEVASARKNRR